MRAHRQTALRCRAARAQPATRRATCSRSAQSVDVTDAVRVSSAPPLARSAGALHHSRHTVHAHMQANLVDAANALWHARTHAGAGGGAHAANAANAASGTAPGAPLASAEEACVGLQTIVTRFLTAHPNGQVVLTGHGMGGGIANVLYLYVLRQTAARTPEATSSAHTSAAPAPSPPPGAVPPQVVAYTFGQPRVFRDPIPAALRSHFALAHAHSAYFRVTNEDDVFVLLPPALGGQHEYKHVGAEYSVGGFLARGARVLGAAPGTVTARAESARSLGGLLSRRVYDVLPRLGHLLTTDVGTWMQRALADPVSLPHAMAEYSFRLHHCT
ncbi:hypothetical protein EON68_05030, partial [archaeon]